ncbi:MAG: helix-turn-helix domain-containing protein [Candidatus Rokubacteria bacterium]|nr:helix-turn-helix domain-containing protein [Candidatus Rokubacteria bacterium]
MAKIETAIKEAILRGARRQARTLTTPLRREVRRLRLTVAQLRRDVAALRDVAGQWQRTAQSTAWRPEVSETELRRARLSPRLIQKLRARLALSQAALARLAGVSTGAVVQWERGRSTPSGQNRRNLLALRKLGRRDVKRLLAGLARQRPPAARARRRRRGGPRRRAGRRRG